MQAQYHGLDTIFGQSSNITSYESAPCVDILFPGVLGVRGTRGVSSSAQLFQGRMVRASQVPWV